MTKPSAGKSRKKDQLLVALLTEKSIEQAAKVCGISKRTALRWMADESFERQFSEVKKQLLAHATSKLRAASGEAVETLKAISTHPTAPPASRVAAARAILEMALRANEAEELEARIRALEGQSDEF